MFTCPKCKKTMLRPHDGYVCDCGERWDLERWKFADEKRIDDSRPPTYWLPLN